MKRFFSAFVNLFFIGFLCFSLAGCTVSQIPLADSSPWHKVDLNTEANPLDISFSDENHGFLIGTNRLILETNDGGETWGERSLDLPEGENFRLISIDFLAEEGWIVGQPGLILHSSDAGNSWKRLDLGNNLPGDPYLITTLGKDSAELATTAGAIYRTNDGGSNWDSEVSEASGGIRDLRRNDAGDYLSASSLGNFYASLDPTQNSWVPHQRASSKRVQSVGFLPDGGLWMLSRGAEIRFSREPQTIDEWSKPIIPITNGYNYLDLAADPNGNLWTAGGNGTLLVSNNLGEDWEIDPVGDQQPSNFIRILFEKSFDNQNIKGFVLGERGILLKWEA